MYILRFVYFTLCLTFGAICREFQLTKFWICESTAFATHRWKYIIIIKLVLLTLLCFLMTWNLSASVDSFCSSPSLLLWLTAPSLSKRVDSAWGFSSFSGKSSEFSSVRMVVSVVRRMRVAVVVSPSSKSSSTSSILSSIWVWMESESYKLK